MIINFDHQLYFDMMYILSAALVSMHIKLNTITEHYLRMFKVDYHMKVVSLKKILQHTS